MPRKKKKMEKKVPLTSTKNLLVDPPCTYACMPRKRKSSAAPPPSLESVPPPRSLAVPSAAPPPSLDPSLEMGAKLEDPSHEMQIVLLGKAEANVSRMGAKLAAFFDAEKAKLWADPSEAIPSDVPFALELETRMANFSKAKASVSRMKAEFGIEKEKLRPKPPEPFLLDVNIDIDSDSDTNSDASPDYNKVQLDSVKLHSVNGGKEVLDGDEWHDLGAAFKASRQSLDGAERKDLEVAIKASLESASTNYGTHLNDETGGQQDQDLGWLKNIPDDALLGYQAMSARCNPRPRSWMLDVYTGEGAAGGGAAGGGAAGGGAAGGTASSMVAPPGPGAMWREMVAREGAAGGGAADEMIID